MPKKFPIVFVILAILAIAITACSTTSSTPTIVRLPTTTLVPTQPPLPTPVPPTATVPPTPTQTATATLTVLPTLIPTTALNATPTSASEPTSTATASATATQTRAPTLAPPTAAAPGGMFVTSMRVEPNPVRGAELTFSPTFFNNTGSAQNVKWVVYIYRADTPGRRIGETAALYITIPQGTSEQKGAGFWKLALGGPCDYFYAEVAYLDVNNRGVSYTTPDGTVFQKGLTVCPP